MMKGLSPLSADQYAPLLCLWGIKSLKRKGCFCIKIQTMVHKTFFLSHSLALCFILSLLHFLPAFHSTFLSWKEGGVGLFNEAGNLDSVVQNACRRQTTKVTVTSNVAVVAHMYGFTYRFSNIAYSKQMSPLRQTCILC